MTNISFNTRLFMMIFCGVAVLASGFGLFMAGVNDDMNWGIFFLVLVIGTTISFSHHFSKAIKMNLDFE